MSAAVETSPDQRQVITVALLATISTVLPGFLVGALSVQIIADFDVTEGVYGWGLGGFFLAATAGSVVLGRLVQVIGPRAQISAALIVSVVSQLVLAGFARSFWAMVGVLAAAGLANSGNQTAVNMALSEARLPRLGLAMALKQSGMPAASMLGGLAVPVVALTVGWRWAYVGSAMMAVVALILVRRVIDPAVPDAKTRKTVPDSPREKLIITAVGAGLLAFAAGALNAWIVGSGVDAGLSEGFAGLMLSVGAGSGIALRILFGTQLDGSARRPFRVAAAVLMAGVAGFVLLTFRSEGLHVVATVIAFMGGWTWPVFTNFGVVRANPNAPGAATGITQMGVYIGVFAGPLLTGMIIEAFDYPAMWSVAAVSALLGAAALYTASDAF